MLNPAVLRPLWRTQTKKWETLGKDHLDELVDLTTDVARRLFEKACEGASDRVRRGLDAKLDSFSHQSRQKVQDQLKALCHRNSSMALQTNNPDFLKKVRSAREQRFYEALMRYMQIIPATTLLPSAPKGCEKMVVVDDAHMGHLFNELHPNGARAQNVEDEIHDLLKAYYEVCCFLYLFFVVKC